MCPQGPLTGNCIEVSLLNHARRLLVTLPSGLLCSPIINFSGAKRQLQSKAFFENGSEKSIIKYILPSFLLLEFIMVLYEVVLPSDFSGHPSKDTGFIINSSLVVVGLTVILFSSNSPLWVFICILKSKFKRFSNRFKYSFIIREKILSSSPLTKSRLIL